MTPLEKFIADARASAAVVARRHQYDLAVEYVPKLLRMVEVAVSALEKCEDYALGSSNQWVTSTLVDIALNEIQKIAEEK